MQFMHRCIVALSIALSGGILLVFAGLTGMAGWESDEYMFFFRFRDQGLAAVNHLILYDSPRPFAYLAFYLYSLVVSLAARPLIGPFLLLCWGMLGVAALHGIQRYRGRALAYRLMLALSLLALFLTAPDIYEPFYWPAAAIAYLPTLAAATWLFFRIAEQRNGAAAQAQSAIALIIAATSSEMGAIFACTFSLCETAFAPRPHTRGTWLCRILPLAASLCIFALLLFGHRIAGAVELGLPLSARHRFSDSFAAGGIQFLREISYPRSELVYSPLCDAMPIVMTGIFLKMLFFFGMRQSGRLLWPHCRATRQPLILAVALLAACYASIVITHYQFGIHCCTRHATLRQCFYMLALAALAVGSLQTPQRDGNAPRRDIAGALLLTSVALFFFGGRLSDVEQDYAHYASNRQARRQTWQSGLSAGDSMVFYLPPHGNVVNDSDVPAGHYSSSGNPPPVIQYVLRYFKKKNIEVVGP